MASVYWIHLPEHTDITTSGYIGFTSKTVEGRFKKHRQDSFQKNKRNYTLHHAIRKYDSQLQVTTLVEGSDEYCLMIEEKLRPCDSIGWNQVRGGSKPPSPVGRVPSRASLDKAQETRKRNLENETPEEREIRCLPYRGRKFSEESKQRMSVTASNRLPWKSSKANLRVWESAEELFDIFISQKTCGNHKLSTLVPEFSKDNLETICNRFNSGWQPSRDEIYLKWLSERKENNVT